ncbi:MAG: hypothetical protein HPY50_18690 [Firmicutes bacterium]|nr:hypothetical protein [Bacillota bacterium]
MSIKIEEVIAPELGYELNGAPVVGIDIGSRTAKGVLLADGIIYTAITPTGLYMQQTAEEIMNQLLKKANLEYSEIAYIVGTGYGRIALEFEKIPHQVITEISCHAMGSHYLNSTTRTIVDIGGQDSKAIKVDTKTGKVVEFVMNDKCAAGTGRFLEKVANLLDLTIDELGRVAINADKRVDISSQCVVFAESEVISLKARGERREDIAAGIHYAVARRVRNLLNRVGLEAGLVFSGGVSNNVGMKLALEDVLGLQFSEVKMDTIYAGALGSAIYAQKYSAANATKEKQAAATFLLDLSDLQNRISKQQEAVMTRSTKASKQVGYLCVYTPLEILNSAGVAHTRLFKSGDSNTVASGELLTQSVFCDLTKSCLGAYKEGDPLYTSLDKVYTFYTCDSMKKAAEALNQYFVPTEIFVLPRMRSQQTARSFFREELLSFKEDLESLTSTTISENSLQEQIVLYNQVRGLIKKISELRKRPRPPLTGRDFLEFVKAYYYLPPEELLDLYGKIYEQLRQVPENNEKTIRLMMAGGIVADGDRRLLEIIEDEIGARIVVEDHCTGLKPFYHQISETGDPLQALADGYLDQAPCARMNPLKDRVEFSGKLAQEYSVDGIIYTYLKFCPSYGLSKNEFLKHYQNLGLPVLEIASDYSRSDEGQLKTRLEAFIEVLGEKGEQLDEINRDKKSA